MNLSLRRNIYSTSGKDVTPDSKDKEATSTAAGGEAPARSQSNGDSHKLEEALQEPARRISCHSCGSDCTRLRWHRAKPTTIDNTTTPNDSNASRSAAKYDICPTCYTEGHFPGNTRAAEYIRLENTEYPKTLPSRERPWTDSETLSLLEALEEFDEDWNAVADHVGTRTRDQCILKFLQLDIEDPYLNAEAGNDAQTKAGSDGLAYLSGGRVPFSQVDNPVLSVVGFLAGSVDPAVAAAAAGRGITELRKERTSIKDRLSHADEHRATSSEPKTEPGTGNEAMDIDPEPNSREISRAGNKSHQQDPAATALALSATRASALATHQERHISTLLSTATSLQLEKLNLKLQQFSELESLLQAERRDLERRKRDLFLERLAWRRRCENVKTGVERGLNIGLQSEDGVKQVVEALGQLGFGGGVGGLQLRKGGLDGSKTSSDTQKQYGQVVDSQQGQPTTGEEVPKQEPQANDDAMQVDHETSQQEQQQQQPQIVEPDVKPLASDESGYRSLEI